jgi:glycosyltransferase involved in cell wall biosynthesis
MSDPLVSVVLTTNRGGPFLREALESVVHQTWKNWEIVIVDDGSPDGEAIDHITRNIERCHVHHQANAGLSVARNTGAALAKGKLIAFIDDDDTSEPERLTCQVAALEAKPDAVACHTQYDVIDVGGAHIAGGHDRPEPELTVEALLRLDAWVLIGTILVRREAFEYIGGFNPLLLTSEDMDLVWRLALMGPLVYVPEVLVHSRQHPDSMTTNVVRTALGAVHAHQLQQWAAERRGDEALVKSAKAGIRQDRRYWSSRLIDAALTHRHDDPRRALGELVTGIRISPVGVGRSVAHRLTRR